MFIVRFIRAIVAALRGAILGVIHGVRSAVRWLLHRGSHVAALLWLAAMGSFVFVGTLRAQSIWRVEAEQVKKQALVAKKKAEREREKQHAIENAHSGTDSAEGRQAAQVAMGDIDEIEGVRDKRLEQMGVLPAGGEEDVTDGGDSNDAGNLQTQLASLKEFAKIRGGPGGAEDVAAGAAVMGSANSHSSVDEDDETGPIHVTLPDGGIAAWIARNRKKSRRGFGDKETLAILAEQQASSGPGTPDGSTSRLSKGELSLLQASDRHPTERADGGVLSAPSRDHANTSAPIDLDLRLLGSKAIDVLVTTSSRAESKAADRTTRLAAPLDQGVLELANQKAAPSSDGRGDLETLRRGLSVLPAKPPIDWAVQNQVPSFKIAVRSLFRPGKTPRLSAEGVRLLGQIGALLQPVTKRRFVIFIDNKSNLSTEKRSKPRTPAQMREILGALEKSGLDKSRLTADPPLAAIGPSEWIGIRLISVPGTTITAPPTSGK